MRVCLKINAAFQSMVTVSASEPFLSETAYSITATSFNIPRYCWTASARDKAVGPPEQHNLPSVLLPSWLFQNPPELEPFHPQRQNQHVSKWSHAHHLLNSSEFVYEIRCAGLSPDRLCMVIYEGPSVVKELRGSMNLGASETFKLAIGAAVFRHLRCVSLPLPSQRVHILLL
jgi:hypothetical protein